MWSLSSLVEYLNDDPFDNEDESLSDNDDNDGNQSEIFDSDNHDGGESSSYLPRVRTPDSNRSPLGGPRRGQSSDSKQNRDSIRSSARRESGAAGAVFAALDAAAWRLRGAEVALDPSSWRSAGAALAAGPASARAAVMSAMPTEYQLRASALHLQFGELWQAVAAEGARLRSTGESYRPVPRQRPQFRYLASLDLDVLHGVLDFLDPASLGTLGLSCKTMARFCGETVRENALFRRHYEEAERRLCVREFGPADVGSYGDEGVPGALSKRSGGHGVVKRAYIRLKLLETEAELRHFLTQRRLLAALCQMPKGSVVRVVSNIGYFENAAMALAISHHRQFAMSTVILSRSNDAILFRKRTDYRGPVSFYSQDNISTLLSPHPSIAMPHIDAPGFLGYAVNLLRLDADEEYMRYTFLLAAYKNITFWATGKDMSAARACGALPSFVRSCALDVYAATAEDQQSDACMSPLKYWFRFGSVGTTQCPCFISIARPRRRVLTEEALQEHVARLQARRDRLLLSLVHF